MKISLFPAFILLLLFWNSLAALSQIKQEQNEIDIDPRQYVNLKYRKNPTNNISQTIWIWENDRRIPNQKLHYLDPNGEIDIDFLRDKMISNINLEGTVSLEAEISGSSGTRKIEVNPYSEIGIQRKPIGVKSEPPLEIANKLINMILELSEVDTLYKTMMAPPSFSSYDLEVHKQYLDKRVILDNLFRNPASQAADIIVELTPFLKLINPNFTRDVIVYTPSTPAALKLIYDRETKKYASSYNASRKTYILMVRPQYLYILPKLNLVLDYLSSFENGGEDATKAFLTLINKDLVNYRSLKNSLLNAQSRMSKFDFTLSDNDPKIDTLFSNNYRQLIEATKYLNELSRFEGSKFETIVKILSDSAATKFEKRTKQNSGQYYAYVASNIGKISQQLSMLAGKMIYRKLVYANIDLGKSGAKTGEVLNIYLTWILDSKKDSLSNSPRLPIGKYFIQPTGWRGEISDMFSLVKRINETKTTNLSSVSPSNYKGSGGAVLMWTYYKEDKGFKVKDSLGVLSLKRKNRFANFLEPSIGMNVSYLDFDTEKDVEIGTGLQIGLFRNKIFFGYGINLHMLRPKDQSPAYFYLGFSFAKISDLFKSSNNIQSMQ